MTEAMSTITKADCPYCGQSGTFITEGVWVSEVSAQKMLEMFNVGWRRFGHYFWRQVIGSCCEQVPIRTDTSSFVCSDGHKKVWKRIERHVRTGKGKGEALPNQKQKGQNRVAKKAPPKRERGVKHKHRAAHHVHKCPAGHQMKFFKGIRPVTEPYADRVTCDVCLKSGLEDCENGYFHCSTCSVDTHPECIMPKTPGCHSCGKAMSYLVHTLPLNYKFATCDVCQGTDLVNDDKGYYHCNECLLDRHIDDGCSFQSFPEHIIKTIKGQPLWEYRGVKEIEVRVIEPSFTPEKYELFLKYHKVVHGEDEGNISVFKIGGLDKGKDTLELFKAVLVETPLSSGTFHVEYRLDGNLFAVTVMDCLKDTVNSVYCYYDPEYRWYTPGRLSILYEIAWARSAGIRYYSLGTYNSKMTYKADYRPFQLLNVRTHVWEDLPASNGTVSDKLKEEPQEGSQVSLYFLVISVPLAVAFVSVLGRAAMDAITSYAAS